MRKILFTLLTLVLLVLYLIINPIYTFGNEIQVGKLIFFYSPYCNSCQQAEPIINKLSEKGILVERYNIQEPGSLSLMMQLLVEYEKLPSLAGQVPAFFYDNRVQIGFNGEKEFAVFIESSKTDVSYKTNSLTIVGIFLAGLADGINPCTLNVLLVLLAIMANRDKVKLLRSGVAFVLGVMSVYFMLGIGLGHIVNKLAFLQYIAPFLYTILGFIILISIFGEGQQFTHGAKIRLGKMISKIRDKSLAVPYVFVIGLCSSLFEFICTGQIYLPTIYYLSTQNAGGYIFRLFLYNLAFSLPMLLVIGSMYYGKNAIGTQGIIKNIQARAFSKIVMILLGGYFALFGLYAVYNLF